MGERNEIKPFVVRRQTISKIILHMAEEAMGRLKKSSPDSMYYIYYYATRQARLKMIKRINAITLRTMKTEYIHI